MLNEGHQVAETIAWLKSMIESNFITNTFTVNKEKFQIYSQVRRRHAIVIKTCHRHARIVP